jgi:hypothetical protein
MKGGFMDTVKLERNQAEEINLKEDPILAEIHFEQSNKHLYDSGEEEEWDSAIDLRVMRPRAVDLRKYYELTGNPIPPAIEASLGPNIPILINHVVTPFSEDGRSPVKVWGLGYEFIVENAEGNTVSVLPSDETLKVAEIDQEMNLGLQIDGGVGIPKKALEIIEEVPAFSLTNAKLEASTDQKFQLSLHMTISLRKVVGAPVGAGGAQWKMYRQDEKLDKPHTLLQTILIDSKTENIQCRIKTWAKQAGWLGTGWGAKFWSYKDQIFDISLAGLE